MHAVRFVGRGLPIIGVHFMGNMDSFTVAVVIGVLVMLGMMIVLTVFDKGGPPPEAAKERRKRPS